MFELDIFFASVVQKCSRSNVPVLFVRHLGCKLDIVLGLPSQTFMNYKVLLTLDSYVDKVALKYAKQPLIYVNISM